MVAIVRSLSPIMERFPQATTVGSNTHEQDKAAGNSARAEKCSVFLLRPDSVWVICVLYKLVRVLDEIMYLLIGAGSLLSERGKAARPATHAEPKQAVPITAFQGSVAKALHTLHMYLSTWGDDGNQMSDLLLLCGVPPAVVQSPAVWGFQRGAQSSSGVRLRTHFA